MPTPVRKAVFPSAGLGTRFLPATKAQPKEMLPLVDKPLVQYAVEECVASGVKNVIIVTSRGKSSIEDHFDASFELEQLLASRKKNDLLESVRKISDLCEVSYIRQKEALGLGHAVLVAKNLVAGEPFVVVLSDDVIYSKTVPCTQQMISAYEKFDAPVIALMEVPRERISAYGAVAVEPEEYAGPGKLFRITDMVEKPKPEVAPSNLAIIGRYVLTPDIFDAIESTEAGAIGEIQLTDGIKRLSKKRPVYGLLFEGTRYDAGDKLGFLKANVEYGMRREDFGAEFREYLRNLKID